ncbi:MAG: class I SAM-dependent methyltransferase [Pseudomonadales bacterium]|nr:class I SAM-dependent methyltransferase [Pseudomonadales bacterium]MBL6815938.1 class I SAM-dependent methyltransferase [Pseudomonadales bacterium]MBL6904642.1 class I SAM-dependent methyltransferase [Pseudomonadales bacterium]
MIKIAKFSAMAMVLTALTSLNSNTVLSTAYAQEGSLSEVLSHERRDGNRARDEWRHPSRTLSFFGIDPGMTVAEVLPGSGGWYTQILNPLTAQEGRLIGLTYPDSLWSQMFNTWDDDARERNGAHIEQMDRYLSVAGVSPTQPIVGYTIDNIPGKENGQADAVLFFRAMHHLFRFDEPLIDTALSEVYDLLTSGGVVGVVQHRAPESAAADFASGNNGYVKQSAVVAAFERAGFVLEASSEMNANENDSADNFVWRLPPTRRDNPETLAIGESDRMTLRFRKP